MTVCSQIHNGVVKYWIAGSDAGNFEENARTHALFALAPELLEALKKICDRAIECEMHNAPSMVDALTWDDILEARVLIKKLHRDGE